MSIFLAWIAAMREIVFTRQIWIYRIGSRSEGCTEPLQVRYRDRFGECGAEDPMCLAKLLVFIAWKQGVDVEDVEYDLVDFLMDVQGIGSGALWSRTRGYIN